MESCSRGRRQVAGAVRQRQPVIIMLSTNNMCANKAAANSNLSVVMEGVLVTYNSSLTKLNIKYITISIN